jgi:hypothetical protein
LETARIRSLQAFRPYELFSKTLTTTFVEVDRSIELSGVVTQLDGWGCRLSSWSGPVMKVRDSEGPNQGLWFQLTRWQAIREVDGVKTQMVSATAHSAHLLEGRRGWGEDESARWIQQRSCGSRDAHGTMRRTDQRNAHSTARRNPILACGTPHAIFHGLLGDGFIVVGMQHNIA